MLLRRGCAGRTVLARRAAPAALVAALLLGGCTGGDPEPSPGPEVSESGEPTASPSASPTETQAPVAAPEPPADLQRTDEIGAAAAAQYFLSLYSYTMQTGDVAAWDAMSLETCGFCARAREFAVSTRQAGEVFTGAEITVLSTFVHPIDTLLQAYPVDVEFTQTGALQQGADGTVIQESPPDSGVFGVDVTHVAEGWRYSP
jgi:hypothetical protein